MLYFGRVVVHDPFIAFGVGGKKISVQSALELGRVRKTSAFDTVLSREAWLERAREIYGPKAGVAEIIATLAGRYHLRHFRVPDDFPAALYVKLTQLGLKLKFADGLLFPEREIKSPWEAACIREGNRLCSVGYSVVEKILRATKVRGGPCSTRVRCSPRNGCVSPSSPPFANKGATPRTPSSPEVTRLAIRTRSDPVRCARIS
jgi:Xaa-Pro aminopeptidase